MRAKGRAKRRIAIILTLIMALQSVFAASAFAGTEGDVLNVRGFGKAIYDGIDGTSRKGRLYVVLRKYV